MKMHETKRKGAYNPPELFRAQLINQRKLNDKETMKTSNASNNHGAWIPKQANKELNVEIAVIITPNNIIYCNV